MAIRCSVSRRPSIWPRGARGPSPGRHECTQTTSRRLPCSASRWRCPSPGELAATPDWDGFLLACLLHDVGKGRAADDHSRAGARLAARALAALGEPPEAREVVAFLVREHLLLPETAARRDLDDPALIARLAERIGSRERLVMLYVLTVADSMSTGSAVWTPWTATLVRELFFKVLTHARGGGIRAPR